jgi:hypothetical protein
VSNYNRAIVGLERLEKYTTKEIRFLSKILAESPREAYLFLFTKDFRVKMMVYFNTRNESYLYRILNKFVRNGDIHQRKRGVYMINPKLAYTGPFAEYNNAVAMYQKLVLEDSI